MLLSLNIVFTRSEFNQEYIYKYHLSAISSTDLTYKLTVYVERCLTPADPGNESYDDSE